jgi:uncharacterized membrane protein (UPF0182 family)
MEPYRIERGKRRSSPASTIGIVAAILALLLSARSIASFAIEIAWWNELGQFRTWLQMLYYGLAPVAAATLLAFAALWAAHARALKFAGTGLREHRAYSWISTGILLVLAYLIAASAIDSWTVVRFAGSRGLPAAASSWHDTVFQKPLSFYLFDLPFYLILRTYVLALVIFCILVYWIAARAWQIRYRFPDWRESREIDPGLFRLEGGLESKFLRGAAVILLLALAARFFLGRYEMVYNSHGSFLVGIDWVDQNIGLPLQWLMIVACLAAAAFVWTGRWFLAASMAASVVLAFVVPPAVSALYVRPNEISLERPYIQTHISTTLNAFGLGKNLQQIDFRAQPNAPIDVAANQYLLDNVRLWDDRPYHDTITQLQALRTYYAFHDSDVDRYTIDGQYKQVLLSPRELDISQLPDARANWINPAFIYTHGYGLVLSEVSKMTNDGLPVLAVDDAPPKVKVSSLKLTRPEIYYGELTHEPVFVNTAQKEFNYPSGEQNAYSSYNGKGGVPISSLPMRLAASIAEGEANIMLTDYLTPNSRMMIHRKILDRLNTLAGFLSWDSDPYLVITDAGRLVWIVDGYTTSDAHPYSQTISVRGMGNVNYIRNAVKATVDAYDGETHLYLFAAEDPIINSYQRLFPDLFLPASQMPADLRRHARYPETMFRIQAEIYRTYHMFDPQSFYNKEDVWDIALHASGQENGPTEVTPTYLMATLPGESQPEFLLMIPYTPHNKNNLIGLLAARCDGPHLGEMSAWLLSKQELIPGPMNVSAYVNQDQNISKDLTLWNQQGSHVIRGKILVLPMGNTFLYMQPIYIQSTDASMPQLKKVVLLAGNRLISADTYAAALAQLAPGASQFAAQTASPVPTPRESPQPAAAQMHLDRVREHLRKYREFAAQGRWAEAGKELEAIEAEVKP